MTHEERNINTKLPYIIIGLLKYCRQESLDSKWNELSFIINSNIKNLTPETRAEYAYEDILQSYYLLNFDEAKTKINNWEANKQLPYHEVKRAGLLAEFGMLEEAITILEESLSIIRRNSLLSSKNNDYSVPLKKHMLFLYLEDLSARGLYLRMRRIYQKISFSVGLSFPVSLRPG